MASPTVSICNCSIQRLVHRISTFLGLSAIFVHTWFDFASAVLITTPSDTLNCLFLPVTLPFCFGFTQKYLANLPSVYKWISKNLKVTMNMLCARLFIIIFMIYTHKSEYIPTVTNFESILGNCLFFLWKITALQPSVLNFWGWLIKFCQKSSGQTVKKWLCWSWFTKNATQNFV